MTTEIPKEQLKPGHWYVGEGRLGPLAMWTGKLFVGPGFSMGFWELGEMDYGSRGFSPYWEFNEQRYRDMEKSGKASHG
jgi:hypothetical protein